MVVGLGIHGITPFEKFFSRFLAKDGESDVRDGSLDLEHEGPLPVVDALCKRGSVGGGSIGSIIGYEGRLGGALDLKLPEGLPYQPFHSHARVLRLFLVVVHPLAATHQVHHHAVAHPVAAVECLGFTVQDLLGLLWRYGGAHHLDDNSPVVLTPTAGATAHLDVLSAGDIARLKAVELLEVRENDRLCGHVNTNGEGLRGKQDLYQALAEQNLDNLLQQR